MVNICLFNCRTKHESNRLTPTPHIKLVNQLFYTMIVIARSLRRRRTDIRYVGESSLDVGEQTVGETTVRQLVTMGFFTQMKGSARNVCTFFNVH